jgi:hypothetical protein
MSWHCSRALVAGYWAATSLDGAPSAPSNTTHTPEAYYWPDKTTEHSRLSRFGMTSEPLTADRGAELLTWFREVSLARTSAQLVEATGSTVSAVGSGRKWLGLLARFDRDTSTWRTPQSSLLEGSDEYSETWPRWGSMRNGESWERQTWEPNISATESGLWPTPNCIGYRSDGELLLLSRKLTSHAEYLAMTDRACNSKRERFFPTPTVAMAKGSSEGALTRKSGRSRSNDRLDYAVEKDGRSGRLNPEWIEWLMGWPIGWTELKPLATGRFREWLQQHSIYFQEAKEAA